MSLEKASHSFLMLASRLLTSACRCWRQTALVAPLAAMLSVSLGCGKVSSSPLSSLETPSATRYPIVLHHGFLGFNRIISVDYFYKVPQTLQDAGFQAHTTSVRSVGTIISRAHDLSRQIDKILEKTGAEQVNIIAHSMGGLDARYLISSMGYGDRVAALFTVSTPHQGTPIADWARTALNADALMIRKTFGRLFGSNPNAGDDNQPDFDGALLNLSPEFLSKVFNPQNPDDPRVVYESWAGSGSVHGVLGRDLVDILMWPLYMVLRKYAGDNDGIVPVESSWHGTARGVLAADHADEIGQLVGITSRRFDYKGFYLNLAQELAHRGF